jgi:hypothetical protein
MCIVAFYKDKTSLLSKRVLDAEQQLVILSVSVSARTWFIIYICYWNLQFLSNVIIIKTKVDSEGRLRTKLYDKRDDFNFPIVNFPFICRSRNQIQLFRIYFHIRSRFGVLLFWTKIEKKYGNKILLTFDFFLWKTAVLGQFSRVSSSQIQLLNIHYLKTFPVGRMMDGPSNLVTRG